MTALIDGEGSRTKWEYDSMGRMTKKTYADGSDYEYDYDYEGKLVARTDGKGQITEYSYDTLGRLTGIDYPTDTDVVTVYDDLGRRASVTDAIGTWEWTEWTYDGNSSRVLTETDPDGNVVTYAYDACGDRTDMSLEVDSTVVQDLNYTYSSGRLTAIEGTTGVSPVSFSYSYLTNSNLLPSLVSNNGTSDILSVSRTYDDADRLLTIENVGGAVPAAIASFSYTLDATGRRTRRDDLDGTHISYSYNQRDELIGAVRSDYPETNPFGDYPYQYGYQFDRIGNHLRQEKNGTVFSGRYNNLNELMERAVTGPVRVQGTADPPSPGCYGAASGVLPIGVKVDPSSSLRVLRDYAVTSGAAANTATVDQDTAAWRGDSRPIAPGQTGTKAISIVAVDSAQPPRKTESVRSVELPAANPIPLTYDLNPSTGLRAFGGNMLSDGQWTYTWTEENRLAAVESTSGAPTRQRLTFTYDAQGRRRTKSVYSWATDHWQLTTEHLFLYDQWNVIRESITDHTQNPAATTTNSYVWGLDLSQSLHGASGVGGILASSSSSSSSSSFFCYDGNGNVAALVSADSATVVAEFDYSPFGETIKATGSAADGNPWRFSTKYHDGETALVYYGRRSYSPGLGRWGSRDPIEEAGGANLFGFAANRPIDMVDHVGLLCCDSPGDPDYRSDAQCCQAYLASGKDKTKDVGGGICCDGRKVSCYWASRLPKGYTNPTALGIIDKCVHAHEDTHHDDIPDCPK